MMHSTKLYSEIFTGALNRYGKLTYWNEVTGEKDTQMKMTKLGWM